jgi:hypothetical protein
MTETWAVERYFELFPSFPQGGKDLMILRLSIVIAGLDPAIHEAFPRERPQS